MKTSPWSKTKNVVASYFQRLLEPSRTASQPSNSDEVSKNRIFTQLEFHHLVNYLRHHNYQFTDCLSQGSTQETCSIRYNIHYRDVKLGWAFLKAHSQEGIPATFYLQYGYSDYERLHSKEFIALANAIKESGFKIGLLDSPVDNYLMSTYGEKNESSYRKWLTTDDAQKLFETLSTSQSALEDFNQKILEHFRKTCKIARTELGDFNTMSSHGGGLSQILRAKTKDLGTLGTFISSLFSENWTTDERLKVVGLDADIERFKGRVPNWVNISDGGGKIVRMSNDIKKHVSQKKAINLLINPATWDKECRDGELSDLLKIEKHELVNIISPIESSPVLVAKENLMEKNQKIQDFSQREFSHFVNYLKHRDYQFADCLEQGSSAKTCSFRYDIHHRDLMPGWGFLREHIKEKIPATFYLQYCYSDYEKSRAKDFIEFNRAIKDAGLDFIKLGLHDSPVDNYLLNTYAGGSPPAFATWLKSEASIELFTELFKSRNAADEFNQKVLEHFKNTCRLTRADLGEFDSMASHGGALSQILRPRIKELGELGTFISTFFSENWTTDERLMEVGLKADIERFKGRVSNWVNITEGGGQIVRMTKDIERFIPKEMAINFLIHPATWARERDREWSELLKLDVNESPLSTPKQQLNVAVSQNLSTLASEMKNYDSEDSLTLAVLMNSPSAPKTLPHSIQKAVGFCDYLAGVGVDANVSANFSFGSSLDIYGELVSGAIKFALAPPASNHKVPNTESMMLGQWLRDEAMRSPTKKMTDQLTQSELEYFLFSSSLRALIIGETIQHQFKDRKVNSLVDHGTAIGLIPLIIDSIVPVSFIECSEMKSSFVKAGTSLWAALGKKDKIHFQETSCLNFVYPENVSVVLFGQMLYRVPKNQRASLLHQAVEALEPGGLLIINEIMDRPESDAHYKSETLTSEELFGYMPDKYPVYAIRDHAECANPIPFKIADPAGFKKSHNLVLLVKT